VPAEAKTRPKKEKGGTEYRGRLHAGRCESGQRGAALHSLNNHSDTQESAGKRGEDTVERGNEEQFRCEIQF